MQLEPKVVCTHPLKHTHYPYRINVSNSLHGIGNTIQRSMHVPDSDMHIPQLDIEN